MARDPRDRQSQLAQVAGLCPLTQPTISNYVSPRERIYSRQGRLGREVARFALLNGAPSTEETSINRHTNFEHLCLRQIPIHVYTNEGERREREYETREAR